MHFAVSLPDWNSLDSVRRAHSDLEIAALLFFALLVIFDVLAHLSEEKPRERLLEKIGLFWFAVAILAEIVAYPYGQRNDKLSAQVIVSLDAKAEEADTKAKTAIADSATALSQAKDAEGKSKDAVTKGETAEASLGKAEGEAKNAQAAALNALTLARETRKEADSFEKDIALAKKAALGAQETLAERELTDEQVKDIGGRLLQFAGQEYEIVAYWDNPESMHIANRIHAALQLAHWKYIPPPKNGVALLGGVVGVVVNVHHEANLGTKRAGERLVSTLNEQGIVTKSRDKNDPRHPDHTITFSIGSKR
jgi:hypothetical protein